MLTLIKEGKGLRCTSFVFPCVGICSVFRTVDGRLGLKKGKYFILVIVDKKERPDNCMHFCETFGMIKNI